MSKVKAKAQTDWGKNKNPLEKDIEKRTKNYARSLGVLCRKWSSPSQRSVPDDLFFFPNGVLLIIEFKRKGKKPSKAQQNEIDILTKKGFFVRVVDDFINGKVLVDNFHNYAKNINRR